MVLAGMASIGIRENWPDYLGIVWLGVLIALIHSSVRQVICLVKKQDLPFGENETFTRMLWIGCRSLGVFLLVVVILNPDRIVDVDGLYPFGNMLNPLTAPNPDVIAYTAGMSLAGLGVMFCLMPLWRFRKTRVRGVTDRVWSGFGVVVALSVAIFCLAMCAIGSQAVPALICLAVSGLDLALPVRFGDTEMFETQFDWNHSRSQFLDRCRWLGVYSAFCVAFAGLSVCVRGVWRTACLVGWLAGTGFVLASLRWVYFGGAATLTLSWNQTIGWPGGVAVLTIGGISLIGGLLVASIVGRRSSAKQRISLDLLKLNAFAPSPIVLYVLLALVVGHTWYIFAAYRSGWPFMMAPGWLGEFFGGLRAGPIHGSFSFLFEGNTMIAWLTIYGLMIAGHLNMQHWNKLALDRFSAETSSVPPAEFLVNWLVWSVALLVSALGFAWYGFALVVSGSNDLFYDTYDGFEYFVVENGVWIERIGFAAGVGLILIILYRTGWRVRRLMVGSRG